jgi:hypothetical protein
VKLDDEFPDHPKVVLAGPLAGWLHVCGICYCNRHLTDGFIPRAAAHRLANFEHVGLTGTDDALVAVGEAVDCKQLAAVLCDAGIWEEVAGGYRIHDYLDYQPSKADIEEIRRQKQAAGRAGGIAAAKARAGARAMAPVITVAVAESKPVPKPNPNEEKVLALAVDVEGLGLQETLWRRLCAAAGAKDADAIQKLERTIRANRCSERDIVCAIEAATGPGVRDALGVALSELKKRSAERATT